MIFSFFLLPTCLVSSLFATKLSDAFRFRLFSSPRYARTVIFYSGFFRGNLLPNCYPFRCYKISFPFPSLSARSIRKTLLPLQRTYPLRSNFPTEAANAGTFILPAKFPLLHFPFLYNLLIWGLFRAPKYTK